QRHATRQPGARGRPGRPLAEELAKGVVHVARDGSVLAGEAARRDTRRRLDADTPGETAEPHRLVPPPVGVELVHDLEPVVDRAEMDERMREPPSEIRRQIAALGQAKERLERVALAQPRIVAAIEQLQRLNDELDLADTAASELDVAGGGFR